MSSILSDTKKVLGLASDYTAFDQDIMMYINAAFSVVDQLGVGPDGGFFINDENDEWSDINLPDNQLHVVKTYVYLRVRMLFDPPTMSFMIEAANEQLREYEWRLNLFRELEVG